MKKKLKIAASIAALAVAGMVSANAAATMTINDGVNPLLTITDNDGNDLNPTLGAVVYHGSVGNWNLVVDTGVTKPMMGSVSNPKMSLDYAASSTAGGTLIITFSDTGYGPLAFATASPKMTIDGNALAGSISYSASVNGFSGSAALTGLNPDGRYMDTRSFLASGLDDPATFAMSQTIAITHNGSGYTQGDASLAVPEPSTCVAGAMLLLPFAASTIRFVRKNRTA